MADYGSELLAAQLAQREAWEQGVRYDKALEARGRAVARAWALRPGGVSWDGFVRVFNEGLPVSARIKVSALRRDEVMYREKDRPGEAEDGMEKAGAVPGHGP